MPASAVYDIETPVEEAIAQVFSIAQLNPFTPSSALETQRPRPRSEIEFVLGPGENERLPNPVAAFLKDDREMAWTGELKIDCITDSQIRVHRGYLSEIRNLIAGIRGLINGIPNSPLQNHKLQWVRDGGSSPLYKSAEGYYMTTLLFSCRISVQQNAWALINQ